MSSKQKRKGTTIYLLYSPSLIAGQDTLRSYTAGDSCLRWHICHWFFLDHCLIDWAEFLPKILSRERRGASRHYPNWKHGPIKSSALMEPPSLCGGSKCSSPSEQRKFPIGFSIRSWASRSFVCACMWYAGGKGQLLYHAEDDMWIKTFLIACHAA